MPYGSDTNSGCKPPKFVVASTHVNRSKHKQDPVQSSKAVFPTIEEMRQRMENSLSRLRRRRGILALTVSIGTLGILLWLVGSIDQLTICRLKIHFRRWIVAPQRTSDAISPQNRKTTSGGDALEPRVLKWVTAYFPVWAFGANAIESNPMNPREINWDGLTHVIHFGVGPQKIPPYWSPMVDNNQGKKDSIDLLYAGDWIYPTGSYYVTDSLRRYAKAHGVKILLSGGGGGIQGEAFDYITQDSLRTQMFADAILGFAERYHYDGIEIDWEVSVTRDGMSRLTRVLHRGLSTWSPRGEIVLTVTNGLEGVFDISLQDSVDQYNLMLYDMHVTPSFTGCRISGFNAPLFPPSERFPGLRSLNWNYAGMLDGIVAATSPAKMLALGWSREKLGAGIPFFGYLYAGIDGPNRPSEGVTPQYVSISEIEFVLQHGGRRFFDDSAKVPWVAGIATKDLGWKLHFGQSFYITFDDTTSLREKVAWAAKMEMGGLMIYELWNGWLPNAREGRRDPLLRCVVAAKQDFLKGG